MVTLTECKLIKGGIIATVISGIVSILLVAVLLSFCYDIFIEQQGLEWFIVFYTIGASFSFFDYISNSVLRLYDKFKFNSIINIIMSFVDFLVILLAIYFYPGNLIMVFTAVIFAKFINSIICNGAAFWELRAEILPHFSLRMDLIKDQWKEIRDFTLANSGSRTLHTLIKSGDVLLLGGMAGPIAVGYYSVAKKLAFSILTLTDPLATSIYPQLAKLVSEERNAEIKTMLSRITKTTLVPGIAFLACVYLMQDWIITFLYGDQYIQAAAPFFYLSIHAVLGAVVFWLVYLLLSLNLVVVRFWITFTSGVIIFATGYLLIPQYGATGLAISLLISGIFGTVAGIYAVANKFKRSS